MKFLLSIYLLALSAVAKPAPTTNQIQEIPLRFRAEARKPGVAATVEIQGKKLQFLVDSGSSAHVLDSEVAANLGLKSSMASPGSSPYGPTQMGHLGDLTARIGDVPVALSDSLSNDLSPGGLKKDGFVGLLSPQRLALQSLVVLDLSRPALYIVRPVPTSIPDWLARRFDHYEFDELSRLDDPNDFRETVNAWNDAFGDLKIFLDSGATQTDIYADKPFDGKVPLTIRVGRHRCQTSYAQIHRTDGPKPDAHLLGMDCLKGKILAFGPPGTKSVWVGWPRQGPVKPSGIRTPRRSEPDPGAVN